MVGHGCSPAANPTAAPSPRDRRPPQYIRSASGVQGHRPDDSQVCYSRLTGGAVPGTYRGRPSDSEGRTAMNRLHALLAVLFTLTAVTPAHAKYDPSFRWRVLESEHFLVHFHQGAEDTARRAAAVAEEIHLRLTERVGWTP